MLTGSTRTQTKEGRQIRKIVNIPEEAIGGACLRASWEAQPGPGPPEGWGPCTMSGCLTCQSCCLPGIQRWAQRQPATQTVLSTKKTRQWHRAKSANRCIQLIMQKCNHTATQSLPHNWRLTQNQYSHEQNTIFQTKIQSSRHNMLQHRTQHATTTQHATLPHDAEMHSAAFKLGSSIPWQGCSQPS